MMKIILLKNIQIHKFTLIKREKSSIILLSWNFYALRVYSGRKEENMAHIADIIKYEGDNSTFVWKHPCEDFNSMTQLIVHESQEAIFFMNGEALDLFGPGRHTLETQNILRR